MISWFFLYFSAWSSKAIEKRILKWILEKQQNMKPNLVPKYNLFGNSAVEIGTLASKMDLEIDKIRPGNTMSFYMVDDSDSIFNLKINFGNLKARIRFMLKYQVKYLYHSGERSAAWKMCIIFFFFGIWKHKDFFLQFDEYPDWSLLTIMANFKAFQ